MLISHTVVVSKSIPLLLLPLQTVLGASQNEVMRTMTVQLIGMLACPDITCTQRAACRCEL